MKRFIVGGLLVLAAASVVTGCASDGGNSGYGYTPQEPDYDAMAKQAMDDATRSLSTEDIENINKLGKE